jgi:hypothetical protein
MQASADVVPKVNRGDFLKGQNLEHILEHLVD